MSEGNETHSSVAASVDESMRKGRSLLILKGGRVAAVAAILVSLLFAITDWFEYHDTTVVLIRLITALAIAFVLALSYAQLAARHPFALVSTGFFLTGAGLAGLLWHLDIFPRAYEGGFVLIIYTFCVLIPATMAQTVFVCFVLIAMPLTLTVLMYRFTRPVDLAVFAVSLGGTTAIGVVSRRIANRLWEGEFRAHQELKQAIEDLRAAQDQIVQTEKRAALSSLIPMIAHNLNNPLSIITTNLGQLKRAVEEFVEGGVGKSDTVEDLPRVITSRIESLCNGVERTVQVTRVLHQYSSAVLGQHSPTDLNAVVEMSVMRVGEKARQKRVEIHREYGTLDLVICNAEILSDALVQVLENACDAVSSSGNIRVRTEVITEGNKEKKRFVLITIRDDGPGISHEHLENLFDPSFTTKPPEVGMGLGLPLVRRIIEGNSGKIEFANGSPGTIVSIKLPLNSQGP